MSFEMDHIYNMTFYETVFETHRLVKSLERVLVNVFRQFSNRFSGRGAFLLLISYKEIQQSNLKTHVK